MKSKILLLLLILTLITCKNKPSDNIIDEKFCNEQLEITIDESRITIDNESNIGRIETEKIINKEPIHRK